MSFMGNGINQFWCYMDNEGFLVAQEMGGGYRRVGASIQKYNQVEKQRDDALGKAEEYYDELVKHGIKQKELTAEERFEALQGQIAALTGMIEQQAQTINALVGQKDKAPQKGKVVEPEIIPAGESLNDKYVASSSSGQVFVSQ